MSTDAWVENQFLTQRARLEGIAFRMLGSRASAEDAVQEAWMRVMRSDAASIDNIGAWLTTVVGRVCLDRLKSAQTRHETHAEPEAVDIADTAHNPEHAAVVADSVGTALAVVLDSMSAEERVAFVLHDVFAVPFDSIGEILDRTPQAARKLASRARARVQGTPADTAIDAKQPRALVEAFLRAAREGDFDGLVRMLHPDVVLQPDEAAIRMGSKPETRGAEEVAKILAGGARGTQLVLVDGVAALAWGSRSQTKSVIEFVINEDQITALHVTADEGQLAGLGIEFVE